jgi:ribA/ribD-fused uncharacterized protein
MLPIRDLDNLMAALAAGEEPDYLLFWGHTGAPGSVGKHVLSQWWPADFRLDDQRYPTAEHYMMAEKARLFGDREIEARILTADDPRSAKALGRKVQGFAAEIWDAAAFGIVVRGNQAKFGQNPALGDWLARTAPAVLVEASPVDAIWGIGLSASDPRAADPQQWAGRNLLGFALMAVRDGLVTPR